MLCSNNTVVTSTVVATQGPNEQMFKSMCVDATNKRLYVMRSNNHCLVYNTSNMAFSTSFGATGTGPNTWVNPTGVYVDPFATRLKTRAVAAPAKTLACLGNGTTAIKPGTYKWYWTYTNSSGEETGWGVESNSITLTTTTDADIVCPARTNTVFTHANLYRNTSQSGSTYFYVKQIAIGAATTFTTDATANATISTAATKLLPMNNYAIPQAKYSKVYRDYMFLWNYAENDCSLRWNMAGTNNTSFPSTYELNLDTDDGDYGTGLGVANGELYAFKSNSIHKILADADDPLNWGQTQVIKGVGCMSHWSIKQIPAGPWAGGLIFAGRQGVYVLYYGQVFCISDAIAPEWETINMAYGEKMVAAIDPTRDEYWVSVPYGLTQTTNNRCYIINYKDRRWYPPLTRGYYGMVNGYDSNDNSRIWMGSFNGYILNYQTGTSFLGNGTATTIDGHFKTKSFDFGLPDNTKHFVEITASYEEYATTQSCSFTRIIDHGTESTATTITLNNVVGTASKRNSLRRKVDDHGKFAQYKFRNAGSKIFKIYSLQIDSRLDKKR